MIIWYLTMNYLLNMKIKAIVIHLTVALTQLIFINLFSLRSGARKKSSINIFISLKNVTFIIATVRLLCHCRFLTIGS